MKVTRLRLPVIGLIATIGVVGAGAAVMAVKSPTGTPDATIVQPVRQASASSTSAPTIASTPIPSPTTASQTAVASTSPAAPRRAPIRAAAVVATPTPIATPTPASDVSPSATPIPPPTPAPQCQLATGTVLLSTEGGGQYSSPSFDAFECNVEARGTATGDCSSAEFQIVGGAYDSTQVAEYNGAFVTDSHPRSHAVAVHIFAYPACSWTVKFSVL